MPQGDGTGPDGKGPKKENKGFPEKDGKGKNKGLRKCFNEAKITNSFEISINNKGKEFFTMIVQGSSEKSWRYQTNVTKVYARAKRATEQLTKTLPEGKWTLTVNGEKQ